MNKGKVTGIKTLKYEPAIEEYEDWEYEFVNLDATDYRMKNAKKQIQEMFKDFAKIVFYETKNEVHAIMKKDHKFSKIENFIEEFDNAVYEIFNYIIWTDDCIIRPANTNGKETVRLQFDFVESEIDKVRVKRLIS